MSSLGLLPGVPAEYVQERLTLAGGDELSTGKFVHPESSAALAVNAFGWFVPRPHLFPELPGAEHVGIPHRIEIEYCARFPWPGGHHPWLDVAAFTDTHLIGIESKRFEPFRDLKRVSFSAAYARPVWGSNMARFDGMRNSLQTGEVTYRHLDAAQLVKHAYGLVTDARRHRLRPFLFYIYAEPAARAGIQISGSDHDRHRAEVVDFSERVRGDEVEFATASYKNWFTRPAVQASRHFAAIANLFAP